MAYAKIHCLNFNFMQPLNFQLQRLNFTAQFKILQCSFRFHIIGRRFFTYFSVFLTQRLYLTFLAVRLQLASSKVQSNYSFSTRRRKLNIRCYFSLVLIGEPVLYI